jgi:hypothetical protein
LEGLIFHDNLNVAVLLAISMRNLCEVAFGPAGYLEISMLLGTFSGTSMLYGDSFAV